MRIFKVMEIYLVNPGILGNKAVYFRGPREQKSKNKGTGEQKQFHVLTDFHA